MIKAEGVEAFTGRVSHVVLQDAVREVRANSVRLGPDLVNIDRATHVDGGRLNAGQILRVEAVVGARGEVRAERIMIESRDARDWNPRPLTLDRAKAQGSEVQHGQDGSKHAEHAGEADGSHREEGESAAGGETERDHPESASATRGDRELRDSTDRPGSRDKVDRVEKVERPERASRPERIERPDRD